MGLRETAQDVTELVPSSAVCTVLFVALLIRAATL